MGRKKKGQKGKGKRLKGESRRRNGNMRRRQAKVDTIGDIQYCIADGQRWLNGRRGGGMQADERRNVGIRGRRHNGGVGENANWEYMTKGET